MPNPRDLLDLEAPYTPRGREREPSQGKWSQEKRTDQTPPTPPPFHFTAFECHLEHFGFGRAYQKTTLARAEACAVNTPPSPTAIVDVIVARTKAAGKGGREGGREGGKEGNDFRATTKRNNMRREKS